MSLRPAWGTTTLIMMITIIQKHKQKCIISKFCTGNPKWGRRSWKQGGSRNLLLQDAPGDNEFLVSASFWWLPTICGCITLVVKAKTFNYFSVPLQNLPSHRTQEKEQSFPIPIVIVALRWALNPRTGNLGSRKVLIETQRKPCKNGVIWQTSVIQCWPSMCGAQGSKRKVLRDEEFGVIQLQISTPRPIPIWQYSGGICPQPLQRKHDPAYAFISHFQPLKLWG